jgi:hypothetical protein
MKHRIMASVLAVVAAMLTTASAFAFECYNASRSDQGNASAGANSNALMSLDKILADPEIVGLCPAGVDHVIQGLEDAGFRTDQLINFHALMAGGLELTRQVHAVSVHSPSSSTTPRR